MNNISDERIKELREWLKTYSFTYGQCAEILTLLDDYSSLRAENERLEHLHKLDHSLADQWLARAEKAEAQLAKQAPLIQAVMEAKLFPAPTDGRTCIDSHEKIIREALKLREGKK